MAWSLLPVVLAVSVISRIQVGGDENSVVPHHVPIQSDLEVTPRTEHNGDNSPVGVASHQDHETNQLHSPHKESSHPHPEPPEVDSDHGSSHQHPQAPEVDSDQRSSHQHPEVPEVDSDQRSSHQHPESPNTGDGRSSQDRGYDNGLRTMHEASTGPLLRLSGGTNNIFTLTQPQSFIKISPDLLHNFKISQKYSFSFDFRTRGPSGLILQHLLEELPGYEVLISLEMGRIKVTYFLGTVHFHMTAGRGLNDDNWHHVQVLFTPQDAFNIWVKVVLDAEEVDRYITLTFDWKGVLNTTSPMTNSIYIGGIGPLTANYPRQNSFVGCIDSIKLGSGQQEPDQIAPLTSSENEMVELGCVDKCQDRASNKCHSDSRCVNHYSWSSCDCFGTQRDGPTCFDESLPSLTLSGDAFVTFRQYDQSKQNHQSFFRVSFRFKTPHDKSVLFFARGESDYLAVSISDRVVTVEFDIEGDQRAVGFSHPVTDNEWHDFTLLVQGEHVLINVDKDYRTEVMHTKKTMVYLSPELFVGGVPSYIAIKGLPTLHNYVGCLSQVFLNDVSLLNHLKTGCPKTKYVGKSIPQFGECSNAEYIPITLPTPDSLVWITPDDDDELFQIKFQYSRPPSPGMLISGGVELKDGNINHWGVIVTNTLIKVVFVDPTGNKRLFLSTSVSDEEDYTVEIRQQSGRLQLHVNGTPVASTTFQNFRHVVAPIYLGGSTKTTDPGYVGCVTLISVQGDKVDPRDVFSHNHLQGTPSLDNCAYLHPCSDPRVCQHGGRCDFVGGKVSCDCKDTGYHGRRCQFSRYKRSCRELAEIGITVDGEYMVDIDGEGPFHAGPIWCTFDGLSSTMKIVNNIPAGMTVRGRFFGDNIVPVTYKGFTSDMMGHIVKSSDRCHQQFEYECHNAPLHPGVMTWFEAQDIQFKIDTFQDMEGSCKCEDNRCNKGSSCECDLQDSGHDVINLTIPYHIGISKMFFMQDIDNSAKTAANITLGPVQCLSEDTNKNALRFAGGPESYLSLEGHHGYDMSFAFRTTQENAQIFLQPPSHFGMGGMAISLEDGQVLLMETWINDTKTRRSIKSAVTLNSGEWHTFSVVFSDPEFKVTLDYEEVLYETLPGEHPGPFEGPLYLGGAPEYLRETLLLSSGNLVGCLRGMTSQGRLISLSDSVGYIHRSLVRAGCNSRCDPNPCLGGAHCEETWDSYRCHCPNTFGHSGQHCEKDMVHNAMTLYQPGAFYYELDTDLSLPREPLFRDRIALNFRTTRPNGVLLYANDNFNNFVQLHIQDGLQLVLTTNSQARIVTLTISDPHIASGRPMQVYVTRKGSQVTLTLNDKKDEAEVSPTPLQRYQMFPWENPELETVFPIRAVLPTVDYFLLLMGGTNRSVQTDIPNFIGCIRGLRIDSRVFDLTNLVGQSKGIKPGCQLNCDREPCLNNGTCVEDFEADSYQCRCQATGYHGDHCGHETSLSFLRSYLLMSPATKLPPRNVSVELALATASSRRSVIVSGLFENGYFTMEMTSEGGLLIRSSVEGREVTYDQSPLHLADGRRHVIRYAHTLSGTNIVSKLSIDSVSYKPTNNVGLPLAHSDQKQGIIYIGGNLNKDLSLFYEGCLSNIHISLDGESMEPLKAYHEGGNIEVGPGGLQPSNVTTCPDTPMSWKQKAVFQDYSVPQTNDWVMEPPSRIFLSQVNPTEVINTADSSKLPLILGLCAAVLAVGVLIVFILRVKKARSDAKPPSDAETTKFMDNCRSQNSTVTQEKLKRYTDKTVKIREPEVTNDYDAPQEDGHLLATEPEEDRPGAENPASPDRTDSANRSSELSELRWVTCLEQSLSQSNDNIVGSQNDMNLPVSHPELDPRAPLSSTSEVTLYTGTSRPNSAYYPPTAQNASKLPPIKQ